MQIPQEKMKELPKEYISVWGEDVYGRGVINQVRAIKDFYLFKKYYGLDREFRAWAARQDKKIRVVDAFITFCRETDVKGRFRQWLIDTGKLRISDEDS